MPRKMRVQYPGAMYHVMNRGDRREDIFLSDVDRQDFLKTLAEACEKTGWQVHAYCLMSNHLEQLRILPGQTGAPSQVDSGRPPVGRARHHA
jgi:putative transposase